MTHLCRSMALILLVLLSSWSVEAQTPSGSPTPLESRLTVFISDLHFGVGKDPSTGKWRNEEDFRWEKEFVLFLDKINAMGKGATDLVINGDAFELWQSLENDCRYDDKNLGCTESKADDRLKNVIKNHDTELKALGEFASADNNHVILVPGNHDAALTFPAVARTALGAIPATPGRVTIPPEGYWRSHDGLVYAEHGHQIGKEVNRFENWPHPFAEQAGEKHLQRPWGEQFVQKFYNQWEGKYPIIDNMATELDGLKAGLHAENAWGIAKGSAQFVKFFLFQESWAQFDQILGPQPEGSLPACEGGKPPCWNYQKIRKEQGDRFLVESLPQGDPYRAVADEALQEGNLGLSLRDLSNEEIKVLCDKRALLKKAGQTITECPIEGTLGALKENLLREQNAVYKEHLEKTDRALQQTGKPEHSFDVFVYSHTHRARPAFYPMEDGWKPRMINTGAWQRVVDPSQLQAIKAARGITDDKVLLALKPEDLPPCYSVIMIMPYKKRSELNAQLLFWHQNAKGKWEFAPSCNWKPGK